MEPEQESEFGDFEKIETEDPHANPKSTQNTILSRSEYIPSRVKLPKQRQLIGIVLERLGGKRMSIKTTDNKIRNCRVPGKFRRKFWLRPGNFVIVEPWPDDDKKGDVVYQYRPNEITQLKKKGITQSLQGEF
ncbi:translation initiation factor 1A [Candidatus Pacearchaeota archaeon]|nr:translation initiation factor 1A [Candidatus Pacearchaeota archaeon]